MKRLLRCFDVIEAHHSANLLRAAGIVAEVRNTVLGGALGDIPFTEAGPEVWIDALQDEELAHAVLAAARNRPAEPGWHCSACDEDIEGQFAACWRCGAARPSVSI